jgi:hypothetical protein
MKNFPGAGVSVAQLAPQIGRKRSNPSPFRISSRAGRKKKQQKSSSNIKFSAAMMPGKNMIASLASGCGFNNSEVSLCEL